MPDNPSRSAIFTDLYELTMGQAYDLERMDHVAVFELYFRDMPKTRNYVMAAGLGDVLDYLENWCFSEDDLAYLKRLGHFSDQFLDRLRNLRFTGDVHAVAEGTVVFGYEPVIQVVAPIIQAQIVETFMINQIHFQSLVATKISRVVNAARGKTVVDFGSRRAHGLDAAVKVARTTFIAGGAGSSNVLAGKLYGVPVFGTMAHSYIQAHEDEYEAFERFTGLYPETTLLVDTYDTLEGISKMIELSRKAGDKFRVTAIRLDSGDLVELSKKAREMLDRAGLSRVRIFVSGGLDEYAIEKLLDAEAPIDGFGVGTKMVVSSDAPDLDMVYKLVEYNGEPRTKLSSGKEIYPGKKQIFRMEENGRMVRDTIGRHDEDLEGRRLIRPVMQNGRRLEAGRMSLADARNLARQEMAGLPHDLKRLSSPRTPYPVEISPLLRRRLADWKASVGY